MSSDLFELRSGALCLDFANTVDWHAGEHPEESLNTYPDLIRWGEASGALPGEWLGKIGRLAESEPEEAAAALDRAIGLREAIFRIFTALAQGECVSSEDLSMLNRVLGESLAHLKISSSAQGFGWEWVEGPVEFDQLLWPVARSAAELLTSNSLDRVSACADDRGCGYLFVDTSRNRSRRWCSMDSCGNRAKARKHRERQQVAAS